jgi:hypothetical protein
MKHHHVIENDIVLETIFALAEEGVCAMSGSDLSSLSFSGLLARIYRLLHDRGFISADDPSLEYLKNTIAYMNRRRMFVLFKILQIFMIAGREKV